MVIGGCLRLNLGLNSWKSGTWGVKNVFLLSVGNFSIVFFFTRLKKNFFNF